LTYFESKKLYVTGDKKQIPIIIFNFWQTISPLLDFIEYNFRTKDGEFFDIWRSIQYGLNAIFVTFSLFVLFYKIKYLNFA
jgi:hypothetical protein